MLRKFDYSVVQLAASSFDDRCHPFIVVSADSRAVSLSQLLFLFFLLDLLYGTLQFRKLFPH